MQTAGRPGIESSVHGMQQQHVAQAAAAAALAIAAAAPVSNAGSTQQQPQQHLAQAAVAAASAAAAVLATGAPTTGEQPVDDKKDKGYMRPFPKPSRFGTVLEVRM